MTQLSHTIIETRVVTYLFYITCPLLHNLKLGAAKILVGFFLLHLSELIINCPIEHDFHDYHKLKTISVKITVNRSKLHHEVAISLNVLHARIHLRHIALVSFWNVHVFITHIYTAHASLYISWTTCGLGPDNFLFQYETTVQVNLSSLM